jgi:hypothetical protein
MVALDMAHGWKRALTEGPGFWKVPSPSLRFLFSLYTAGPSRTGHLNPPTPGTLRKHPHDHLAWHRLCLQGASHGKCRAGGKDKDTSLLGPSLLEASVNIRINKAPKTNQLLSARLNSCCIFSGSTTALGDRYR